ncbi:uncharacterized protein LOC110892120 [Helianthus annuus]|uniref:uncharacterized protein LOC110892120 n=1 Tax=Helianthus annuus TaxID=4232 RepID=UPI00165306C6|nr:uncharacterized protein LOC110892120 [Helianthus annuus]
MRRMMLDPVPLKWKKLWDTCDLRSFMLLSLSLQTFLIIVAPLRKRTKSNLIIMLLWSAYLLADWAANFAVGLIMKGQGDSSDNPGKKGRDTSEDAGLLAFWASFILVHLVGPDTITAFSLEDNELWPRHLFGLVFQFLSAVYVFILSLPHNGLWIPTLLVFFNGMLKYIEKTRSFYLASADIFKSSMLKKANPDINASKLIDMHNTMKEAKMPAKIEVIPDQEIVTISRVISANKTKKGILTELEVVQYGYQFYEKFIGLIVDMIYGEKERHQSRDFFLNRTANDAFKVIEVELNLIHEVLFTKFPMVHGKNGAIRRLLCLVTVCLAITLFLLKSKTNFREADVRITYCLLFGALVFDLISLFMIFSSDWTIIALRGSPDDVPPHNSLKNKIITLFLKLKTEGILKVIRAFTSELDPKSNTESNQYANRNGRWSETISTFNLINYSLHRRHQSLEKVLNNLGFTRFLDGISYVEPEEFTVYLRDFIFDELRAKSEFADDLEEAKEINSARGNWVLRVEAGWDSLLKYVFEVDYDQSLIVWHIATNLCYHKEDDNGMHNTSSKKKHNTSSKRNIAKLLSDYMMFLLYLQPNIMSTLEGVAHIRFLYTFTEVSAQIQRFSEITDSKPRSVCEEILKTSRTNVNSLLFESCSLANQLIEISKKDPKSGNDPKLDKWEILSKVWVEMLCYAAINSRVNTQVAQVSKGGELITIVWLLMTHFGFGDQFQPNKHNKRVKLHVGK